MEAEPRPTGMTRPEALNPHPGLPLPGRGNEPVPTARSHRPVAGLRSWVVRSLRATTGFRPAPARSKDMVRTNFVLVDLENVQPGNIGLLYGGPFKIKVFLGTTQCKISLEMVRALQAFGPDVEYI